MCDYSLENVASRKAIVSDRLISTNFLNTVTRGFAAKGDLGTAVCLMSGTELAFDVEPRYEDPTDLQQHSAPSMVARFRQVNPGVRYVHHDALEFPDGTLVPVACLVQGQWATVLQLPSTESGAEARANLNEKLPADGLV